MVKVQALLSAVFAFVILGCTAPILTPVISNGASLHSAPAGNSHYQTQGGRYGRAAKFG